MLMASLPSYTNHNMAYRTSLIPSLVFFYRILSKSAQNENKHHLQKMNWHLTIYDWLHELSSTMYQGILGEEIMYL